MVAFELNLSRSKLNAVGMSRTKKVVTQVTRRTFNRSQALAPVDTGNLRASAYMNVSSHFTEVVGTVVYTAQYAAAVHNGRRALTIRAKPRGGRPGRLKFTVGGRTVYATQVHQPARAGRPYLARALREAAGTVEDMTVTIG
jgi:hypothetical protein